MEEENEVTFKLTEVIKEMKVQKEIASSFHTNERYFDDLIKDLEEYVEVNEQGIAFEVIVATLEQKPFTFSGKAAVYLLEIGLIFGFKTTSEEDLKYNWYEKRLSIKSHIEKISTLLE